jgi:Fe2+ transport system protein FeoA
MWVIVIVMNVLETFSIHGKPVEEPGCDTCPLNRMKSGVAVRIRQLCGAPEVQNRLREIGLGEDQIIKLLTSRGNFICQVCNTRLAISEQLAQLILVEPVRQPARV